jgi:serine/threonine protein kinase
MEVITLLWDRNMCRKSFLLIIVCLYYCFSSTCTNALLTSQKIYHRKFSMQYSDKELSNLRSITEKKLGQKISQDYLLLSTSVKASQSRSEILDCISQSSLSGDKSSDLKLKAKVVKEQDRFDREFKNYQTVCGKQKSMNEFVTIERFEKNAILLKNRYAGVMIMEAGTIDLKKASVELGPVRDKDLVRIAKSMAASLSKIQGKGMCWTDLKTDNFVFVPNKSDDNQYFSESYTCKAIDLESAVKVGQAIVDFSPEIAAPEQIEILTNGELSSQGGRASDYTLNLREPILARKETDIWALGISILHMYLGRYVNVHIYDICIYEFIQICMHIYA